jgi:hypothetical protein
MGTLARPGPFSLLGCPLLTTAAELASPRFPRSGLDAIDAMLAPARATLRDSPVHLPRVYPVRRAASALDAAEAVRRTADLRDPRDLTLVEADPAAFAHAPPAGAAAEIVSLGANALQVHLSGGAGPVVLLETFYPGWKAWADDRPCLVAPAHGAFRAVAAPPGTRRILMRFEPPSFRVGLFVSLLGVGCVAAVSVPRRRSAGTAPAAQASPSRETTSRPA